MLFKPFMVSLPVELAVLILENLPAPDILKCRLVSTHLQRIIDNSAGLKYKVDLFAAGMEDGPSMKLSNAEKRVLLQRYQEAWRNFCTSDTIVQDIPLMDGPLWELSGGILCQSVGRKSLQFKQLPGRLRGISAHDWAIELDFCAEDFTFDPSQGLILAIEGAQRCCFVRPLSLTNGEKHPLAEVERMECPTPAFTDNDRVYIVRICGDLFGLIVREPHLVGEQSDDRLVVRNWKTGDTILSLSGEDYLSLSFLDETHIALSRSTYEATPILTTGTVHLFDLKGGDPEDGSTFTDITLRLPRTTMNGWAYWNVEVVCDPAPVRSSYPSSEVPFHLNQDNRVVAIRARAAQMLWGGAVDLDFFITSKTLLSFFDGIKQGEGDDLDWDEWGPTNARILPSISKQMWCYPVHGSRAIGIHDRNLVIHDFNQKALRRPEASKDVIKDEGVITNTPATEHGLQMYPENIYHRLPFARHSTNIGANTRKGLMISEDSLVLVDEEAKNFRVYSI